MASAKASKTALSSWNTRDLLVTVVLGLVFGLLLVPATYLLVALSALGPVVQRALSALWFIPPFFTAYVIRRPGTALLTGVLCGLVLIPFTPYGVAYLIGGLMYGLCSEVGQAIVVRYRHWTAKRLFLAAAVTGIVFTAISAVLEQSLNFEPVIVIAAVLASILSIGFGGVIAKSLADVVARTGVLNNTALGRETKGHG